MDGWKAGLMLVMDDGYMNRWVHHRCKDDGWMHGWLNKWMNDCWMMDLWMDRRMVVYIVYGWYNSRIDGKKTDGWMDGVTCTCWSYAEQLIKGKVESWFIVSGSFCLHLSHVFFKDLFISHVRLNQVLKAGNHRLRLLIKLEKERQRDLLIRPIRTTRIMGITFTLSQNKLNN